MEELKSTDTSATKAFIFDLDGTLCNTLPDLLRAMNAMLSRMGYPERSREELLGFINRGNRYFVWRSLPDGAAASPDDPLVDRAMAINAEEYLKCYVCETCEYEGMTDALRTLKARGMRLGVLTNKRDRFAKLIVEKLFPGVFDVVRGNIDKMPAKPDPAPALEVAEKLGAAPSECVFVGDSDIDMLTAKNSGMLPVGVLWGYRDRKCLTDAGAKILSARPGELCDIIR